MRRRVPFLIGVAASAAVALLSGACASSPRPQVPVTPTVPVPSVDTRIGWILRLEQQRAVRDASVPAVVVDRGPALRPARTADLADLLLDVEPGVRRRAALAVGRVKAPDAVASLTPLLRDPASDVRAMAAFALGLAADKQAVPAVIAALEDPASEVRARAIEALGLLGDPAAAPPIARAAASCPAVLAPIEPDAEPTDAHLVCQLSLFALVRLQQYDAIAQIVLDPQGQPISRWWPIAYALQRSGDSRAAAPLRALASVPGIYTAGFALRGLAALKDTASAPLARTLVGRRDLDVKVRVAAVRLLAQVGGDADARTLATLVGELQPSSPLALEVISALGTLARPAAFEVLVDAFGDASPAVRAAALSAAAKANPEGFLLVLAGLGRDRDWTVRAALAGVLATFPSERVSAALVDLAGDEDARVHGAALEALATVKSPELPARLRVSLEAADFVERATAARLVGQSKPADGAALLVAAYTRGQSDTAYAARAAALEGLVAYGVEAARPTLEQALSDREWPVRARAATWLRGLGVVNATPLSPAPLRQPPPDFESAALLHPRYSPHALIETRHGVIELELDVVNAAFTSGTFIDLARQGFFNGIRVHRLVPTFVIQAGDPRGDGEGGPGFTSRDELNTTPYLRGTVGMALDWADTGGSQWFITTSPQPHLDARYTAFGRVVNGWDVLDQVTQWDVIERVRIWDGVELR